MGLRQNYPGNYDNFGPQGRLAVNEYAIDALDAKTVNQVAPGDAQARLGSDWGIYHNDGAPDASAQATLDVNPTGDDNGLTFTAVAYGADGNAVTIAYVDPAANDAELSVSVDGTDIVVSLATDENGDITSTAADVLAAIEASAAAAALVTVAVDTSDSGSADDGSGVVTAMAEDALEGGTGVGIGTAGIGSLLVDISSGDYYSNTGTLAVPVWEQLAFVA